MKEFRKSINNSYICEECNRTFFSYQGLRNHIRHSHKYLSQKNYYDKWVKNKDDGKCKICGNNTKFETLVHGYKFCCSYKCSQKFKSIRIKEGVLEKYGVENNFQREESKQKIKKTCLERYGVSNPRKCEKIIKLAKQTCLDKYGNENYNNQEKRKKTCLKKYGVEHPYQTEEIFLKHLKTRRLVKQFNDTNLTYQGSYELDFLEKFYDKIDIENGPSIKYKFEDKNKIYHSDFYIPSKNLIVEIKSSYILTLDTEVKYKKEACLIQDYNYILILNKNYMEFNNLLSNELERLQSQ